MQTTRAPEPVVSSRAGWRSIRPWLDRLRPYTFHLVLAAFLPSLLIADARAGSLWQQHLLGIVTFAFLLLATRFSPSSERSVVWLAVVVWTILEVIGSLLWGIYEYRTGNVPLFVPPGHGLIYLFGLRAMRTPLVFRHGTSLGTLAVWIAGIWAIAGLTILPLWTGRLDIAGALLFPMFAYGIARSRSAPFYAAIFFATSVLEITGTAIGTWEWAARQPLTSLPQGNPPSVVAGAYCLWDFVLVRLSLRLRRFLLSDPTRDAIT